jgi:hypothetical protein
VFAEGFANARAKDGSKLAEETEISRERILLLASGIARDYIYARGTNRHAARSPTISRIRLDRGTTFCAALGVGRK